MSPLLTLSPAQLQQFLVAAVPHHRHLGMRIAQCSEGRLTVELPFTQLLATAAEDQRIHAGAITTLIDTACGSVILTQLADCRRTATLDLRLDFLRRPRSGDAVRCQAECVSIGDALAVTRAAAYDGDGDDPLAIATAAFALFKGRSGEAVIDVPDAMPDRESLTTAAAYANMLGVETQIQDGALLGSMDFREYLVGHPVLRALHGGAIGGLLQLTAAAELRRHAESGLSPRLFGFSVEYLSAALPARCFARAEVVARSRRFANVRVHAYQGDPDRHLAAATAQFLLAG